MIMNRAPQLSPTQREKLIKLAVSAELNGTLPRGTIDRARDQRPRITQLSPAIMRVSFGELPFVLVLAAQFWNDAAELTSGLWIVDGRVPDDLSARTDDADDEH